MPSYDEFAFHKIYHRVNHFCIVELSAFYFDVLKDRLYIRTKVPGTEERADRDLAHGEALTRLLAPILTFTCEEILAVPAETAGRERACTSRSSCICRYSRR